MVKLILASTSPTRRRMLASAGIPCDVEAPGVDEAVLKRTLQDASPEEIAMALAEAKAIAVSTRYPDCLILGADQTLNLDGKLYDKPRSLNEARDHLGQLAGRSHRLETACALALNRKIVWRCHRAATLAMRTPSSEFIEAYLTRNGRSLLSSVGGYKIEEEGVQLFTAIEGNQFVIMGLTLIELCAELRKRGVIEA